MENNTRQLMPLNQVARRLRVPVRWLRAEAEAGRIPCIRAEKVFLCEFTSVENALLRRVEACAGK